MKKVIPILLVVLTLTSCSTVLLTGRRQLNLVSDAELNQMSFAAYKELKDSVPLSADKVNSAMVNRVGDNLKAAVEKILVANGAESEIQNFEWEYNMFKVNQVNAFAMPGGKIAVYDGILPKTMNEAGMAVVVGHEIAHVVAKHSAERLSQQLMAQYGGAILGAAVGGKSAAVQQGIGALYGIGVQAAVLLPYSRKQEYEADMLGLYIMAVAGYDPDEALTFWQRMTADNTQSSSDFMSTHPSDDKRIAQLQVVIPEAKKFYKTGLVPVLQKK